MATAARRLNQQGAVAPALVMTLLALACPQAARAQESGEQDRLRWPIPVVQIGGLVAYDARRDWMQEQQRDQRGVRATLNLSTNTYIWEPWFAQLEGTLGVTLSRNRSDENDAGILKSSSSSTSVIMTGNARLSVLARSRFPFGAHFSRSNSRASGDLSAGNAYASERYGFSQHYQRPEGTSMLAWDRNTQVSADGSRGRQDGWQINATHGKGAHRLQLNGDGSMNTRERSGEYALQRNLTLQHGFTPDPSLSLESMANFSRSGYHLEQGGDNLTRLLQLTSLAIWHPPDRGLMVNGGARLFALDLQQPGTGADGNERTSRSHNINLNGGASYDLSRSTRVNASANLNQVAGAAGKSRSANQSAGISYQPEGIALGQAHYGWSTSAQATNGSSQLGGGRQLALQLNHHLGYSTKLGGGSTLGMDGSQSASVVSSTAASEVSRQLTNSASLSWNMPGAAGTNSVLRLSASDTRSFGARTEFFQLVNLQANSNLARGAHSSWSGNLTIQAVRQSARLAGNPGDPNDPFYLLPGPEASSTFVTSSSGSLRYQNQRLFGIARLRAASELRLNTKALLPLLGKEEDQASAVWENRIDYVIGRTQLSFSVLIARNPAVFTAGLPPGVAPPPRAPGQDAYKINRTAAFYLSRGFGGF
ncbi:MAG: hypothetical protein WA191_23485 [Telluria sp.]